MASSKDEPSHRNDDGSKAEHQDKSEFERFETLTGKLLRVSKKELDEKRKRKAA